MQAAYFGLYTNLSTKETYSKEEIKEMKHEIDTANMQLSNFQCIEGLDNEKNVFIGGNLKPPLITGATETASQFQTRCFLQPSPRYY